MSSTYPVEVRMSTVGTEQVSAQVKNVSDVLGVMQGKLTQVEDGTRRLSATFRQADSDGNKYSITMRQLTASKQQATKATDDLKNSMGGTVNVMGALTSAVVMGTAALVGLYESFKKAASPGVELNALLETSRLGIAATILSYRDFIDTQGQAITGERAMSLAMAEGANVQKLLRSEAFNTTATLEQMLKAYQALQVGASAQKASSQQLTTFTATLGNLATATGRSFEELSAQTSRVLQGVMTIRNPIVALLRGMGVSNETIKSWVAQGTAVEEVQKRLIEFMRIGPEINKTWTGMLSNLKDVSQQLSAASMAPLMDAAKKVGLGIVASFTESFIEGDREVTRIADSAVKAAEAIGVGLAGAFEVAGVAAKTVMETLTGFVESEGGTWLGFFKNIASGFVSVSEFFAKSVILIVETTTHGAQVQVDLLARMHEEMLRRTAIDFENVSKIAAFVSKFTGGAVGKDIAEGAERLSKSLIEQADITKKAREEGDTTTTRLTKGWESVESAVLKANQAIQKIGASGKLPNYMLPGAEKSFPTALTYQKDQPTSPFWSPGPAQPNFWEDPMLYGMGGTAGNGQPRRPPVDTTKADKAFDTFVIKTREMWEKANAETEVGLEKKLALVDVEALRESDIAVKMANNMLKSGVDREKATKALLDRLDAIEAAAVAKKLGYIDADKQKIAEHHAWYLAEAEKLDDQLAAVTYDHYTKQAAILDRENDRETALLNKRRLEEKLTQDEYDALWEKQEKLKNARVAMLEEEKNSVIGYRRMWEDEAHKIVLATDSIAGGLAAGMASIKATVKSTTESVRDAFVGIWGAMMGAAENTFFAVLTGKFESLKDILNSLWNDIAKSFSKMLAEMLQNWLMTGSIMGGGVGNEKGGGFLAGVLGGGGGYSAEKGGIPGLQGGTPLVDGQQQGYGGALLAAGALVYAGGTIANATKSNVQPYTMAGQQFSGDFGGNAKFGDFIGPAVAVAVAGVVGAASIAAALAATGIISAAGTAAAAAVVPVVGWIAAAVILIIGAVLAIVNGPKEAKASLYTNQMGTGSALGNAMDQVYGATGGRLSDINRSGGGSTSGFSSYMHANNDEWMKQWQMTLHAGSPEDMTKDAEVFFKQVFPKLAIEHAFGQTFSGQYHGDMAGGRPGAEGIAGISGVPIMVAGSFDPEAPIPKMLAGLGMTAKAIRGIALQIDMRDPDAFMSWLSRIVAMSVNMKATVASLSKNWIDIQKDMHAAEKGGVTGALADAQQNVIDLAGEIGSYVGDEQLTKMEELQKAADDYYAKSLAAVQALIKMVEAIDAAASDFVVSLGNVFKNPDWLAADRNDWIKPGGIYSQSLATATTPAEVQALWNDFMNDAKAQMQYLLNLANRGEAGMKAAAGLASKFGSIMQDAEKETTVFTLWNDAVDLQGKYAKAAKLSGQAQMDALEEINASAADLYNNLLQIIQGINAAEKNIHGSIQNQIWENNYSALGSDRERRDAINAQLSSVMGGINSQMTAGDISSSASEAQGLISRYLSMFNQNDPGRAQAVREANEALKALDAATHSRLEALKKQAKEDADAAKAVMDETRDAFHDAMVQAKSDLIALGETVTTVRDEFDTKLKGWATEITTSMGEAADALVAAMDKFRTSLEGPPDTGTGGGHHLPPDVQIANLGTAAGDGTVALSNFTSALVSATSALTGGAH